MYEQFQPAASADTGGLTRRRRAADVTSSWSIIAATPAGRGRFRGVVGGNDGETDEVGVIEMVNVVDAAVGTSASLRQIEVSRGLDGLPSVTVVTRELDIFSTS